MSKTRAEAFMRLSGALVGLALVGVEGYRIWAGLFHVDLLDSFLIVVIFGLIYATDEDPYAPHRGDETL